MALRIIFMGTPEFSVPSLRSIIDSGHRVIRVTLSHQKKNLGVKKYIKALYTWLQIQRV